jgi:hypothetical protein
VVEVLLGAVLGAAAVLAAATATTNDDVVITVVRDDKMQTVKTILRNRPTAAAADCC